ncbi:hypothetical protein [Pseudoalteromonas ardens]|uniref:Uncharacterized protein n=1 Tax=Pseudoalteromonas rubra TaxID=43658 RepID=A0A0L0ER66_9GAMM|nr:hypothetical protein [Pseudoalteromonas sp. R96]KNC66899.1 hypothetical protein AC626_14170 [Pseudoalteromonas rubra]MDK1311519.1 hypothetical protein [Pseudoalteromonas sp. R96]
MIFRLSKLAELDDFALRDKQRIKALALAQLPASHKILLNIAKLLLLTPLFMALAFIEGWLLLPVLLVCGLAYPLLTVPLEIQFARPHMHHAISEFRKTHS